MPAKHFMTWAEVTKRLKRIPSGKTMYGIPRGGAIVAGLKAGGDSFWIPEHFEDADIVVDDIIDTGATLKRYKGLLDKPVYALVDKRKKEDRKLGWVVFPWELTDGTADIKDTVTRQLEFIGEDPTRAGLVDTPRRALEALCELTAGLKVDPKRHLKITFDEPGDEMIVVRNIPYWSLCEHHMLPFSGRITVAYVPRKKVVGLSKIPRMIEDFARRLQVQERLTNQIADAMMEALNPLGVGVIVTGNHLCQQMRGVRSQGEMLTSAVRGLLKKDQKARDEFLKLRGQ